MRLIPATPLQAVGTTMLLLTACPASWPTLQTSKLSPSHLILKEFDSPNKSVLSGTKGIICSCCFPKLTPEEKKPGKKTRNPGLYISHRVKASVLVFINTSPNNLENYPEGHNPQLGGGWKGALRSERPLAMLPPLQVPDSSQNYEICTSPQLV